MAHAGDDRLASLTSAADDFSEPGELGLFIATARCTSWMASWNRGYLRPTRWPAPSRCCTNDLIWSRHIHDYLMATRRCRPDGLNVD